MGRYRSFYREECIDTMNNAYLVSEWALIRRNELVNIPDQLEIHPEKRDIPHYLKLMELGGKNSTLRLPS